MSDLTIEDCMTEAMRNSLHVNNKGWTDDSPDWHLVCQAVVCGTVFEVWVNRRTGEKKTSIGTFNDAIALPSEVVITGGI